MAKEASSESGKVISLPTGAVCFGPFRFDPTNVTLSRGDAHIHLPPRALGVLEYLVRRPGLLVSKDELLDAVWADIHVTEDALTQAISLVRQALGDDPRDPSFVETVPRLGYRFVAKVSAAQRRQVETPSVGGPQTVAAGQAHAKAPAGAPTRVAAGSPAGTPRPLAPEAELGKYKIVSRLGAGAMGEVWRARDSELRRDVAIKVVPSEIAEDDKVLRRFRREARLLAQVNHRNIATIHGVEEADGQRFIVMELVEGETLEARLSTGPLPTEEALAICRQVAEAIGAAHNKGIIHRDLKPANVVLTLGQRVKVLDFGLAKEVPPEGGEETSEQTSATKAGVMLGTAPYMSPEQVRGQAVDKRTDIWAFGCLLYELLTGQGAFRRDTVADTLAAILDKEPDWTRLPEDVPRAARRLLDRCLVKNPRDRLHDIADARIEIEEALRGGASNSAGALAAGGDIRLTLSTQLPLWRRSLPWALAAVSLAIAAGAVLWAVRWSTIPPASPPSPSPLSSKITIRPPGEMHLEPGGRDRVMVSPDGSTIAYLAQPGPAAGLYLHSLDTWDPDGPITGLGVSSGRVFSPDGNWIAFFQNDKLKKVSVHGGPPEDICDLPAEPGHLSATWMPDGTIIFMAQRRLWRVSDQGGEPEPVAVPNAAAGEVAYFWPQVIPENDAVTYAILTSNIQHMDDARIAVLDLDTLKSHIVGTGSAPVVSPTGHLLFVQGGVLFAVAFDLETHMPYGPSVLVQQGLGVDKWGFPSYAVAENGSLVYVPGGHVTGDQLVWVDQPNSITKAIDELLMLNGIHLSPSGQLVALDVGVFNPDILIYDLSGGPVVRVAGDGGQRFSTWTRDGGRFFFRETIAGVSSLHSFDLETRERAPFNPELGEYTDPVPYSVSPDGKWMTLEASHPSTGRDILRVPLEGDLVARPWLATRARETYPLISPDGRLIAYRSDESGRNYVQVRAVSATTPLGTRAMSKGTGALKWGADSRSLYYIQPSSGPFSPTRVWTVSIGPEAEPTIGTPELAFDPDESVYWAQRLWDVSADGRLLAAKNAQTGDREIRVILNWFEELMEQVPTRH